jgi:nucleoside-diphosphate kinase
MASERTLVLVKPDGVKRSLIGDVINRFERRGFRIVGLKLLRMDAALADRHYAEHRDKAFFADLVDFITSGPLVAMVVEGPDAVAEIRRMMGATDPAKADPGTIRGDHGETIGMNVVHGSDSLERAATEIDLFFAPGELIAD